MVFKKGSLLFPGSANAIFFHHILLAHKSLGRRVKCKTTFKGAGLSQGVHEKEPSS